MQYLNGLSIKKKSLIPILVQLILLVVICYFYINSNKIIETQKQSKKIISHSLDKIRNLSYHIQNYLNGKFSYPKLKIKLQETKINIEKNKFIDQKKYY